MLKVAIADDENIVRVGLKTLIDWEANKFQLVGLFKNGKEVIDYCLTGRIDILITDIKMPVMDGIELIRNIKKILPDISVVVLSSYDDFQLVSSSYKEGIFDYVLKQFIEPETLLSVLNAIKSRVSDSPGFGGANRKRISAEEKTSLLGSLLFSGNNTESRLSDDCAMLGLQLNPPNLYCLLLKLYSIEKNSVKPFDNIYSLTSNICTILSETVSRYCGMEYLVVDQNTIACILSFPPEASGQSIRVKLEEMAGNIYETLLTIFNIRVYMGCSARRDMLLKFSAAYGEAAEAVEDSFFAPEGIIFYYDRKPSTDETLIDELKLKRSIKNALKYRDSNGLYNIISGLFSDAGKGILMKQENFKNLVVKIVNEIDSFIMENYDRNVQQLVSDGNHSYVQAIFECANRDILREYIGGILAKLACLIDATAGEQPFAAAAKEYIEKNYMHDIGLSDISKHIGINSDYLCRLFKEKTGENLSYYLSRFRIEKSIELMKDSNLSTKQIAEEVGYPNTNYYIKVFKKITGKTISGFKGRPAARE